MAGLASVLAVKLLVMICLFTEWAFDQCRHTTGIRQGAAKRRVGKVAPDRRMVAFQLLMSVRMTLVRTT